MADNVRERFLKFHQQNPHVYQLFKRFATEALEAGRTRYSARTLIERIRWHETVETQGEFKVNDHVFPYYVRMLVAEDPRFDGFFQMRLADADLMRQPPPPEATDGVPDLLGDDAKHGA